MRGALWLSPVAMQLAPALWRRSWLLWLSLVAMVMQLPSGSALRRCSWLQPRGDVRRPLAQLCGGAAGSSLVAMQLAPLAMVMHQLSAWLSLVATVMQLAPALW